MQSIPGLKQCFNLVASLSKKLFTNTLPTANPSPAQTTQDKSLQKLSEPNPSEPNNPKLQPNQSKTSSPQKLQGPKVICFETYLQNGSNTYKSPSFKVGFDVMHNNPKSIAQTQEQKTKNSQSRGTNNPHKNYPSKKIENRYSNIVKSSHQSATQKPHIKNTNTYPPIRKSNKGSDHSADDELSGDQIIGMGKKNQKIIKKHQKNLSVAQCVDINTDDMIFTYDDGDDISSIEAKSETTDEIEPQLLSFISKKAMMNNFYKFQEQKLHNFPQANMKKKASHYQGQTVPRKTSNLPSPKQDNKPVSDQILRQKTKKRAFQLYPGETFEQFKKRILIQDRSSSSENSDQDNYFPGKLIKKEEYERILSQLNSSVSRMDEQKNKQASILVVQKMVDESENQEENFFKREQPILENIENYKIWDNAGDNASFRLYYRDS